MEGDSKEFTEDRKLTNSKTRFKGIRENGNGNGNNKNTSSTKEKSGGTTSAGNIRGTGTTGQPTENKEIVSGLANVKKPIDIEIVPPEKEVKPKRKRSQKKKEVEEETKSSFGSKEVALLITSVSSVVASKKGLEVWKITEKEALSIAEPLTNILQKSNLFNKVTEHSDAIALITASAMVFTPRIVFTAQQIKLKGGLKNANQKFKLNTAPKQNGATNGSNQPNSRPNDRTNATNDSSIIDEFSTVNQIC